MHEKQRHLKTEQIFLPENLLFHPRGFFGYFYSIHGHYSQQSVMQNKNVHESDNDPTSDNYTNIQCHAYE